jgi:hypothetical protein
MKSSCRLLSFFLLLFFDGPRRVAAPPITNYAFSATFPFRRENPDSRHSDVGKVNEFLYRGAQPKEEGVEQLKNLGIDAIVDLRGERHDTNVFLVQNVKID